MIIITIFRKNGKGFTIPIGFKTHLACIAAAAGTVHVMAKEASKKSDMSIQTAIETIRYGATEIRRTEEAIHGRNQ